MRSYKPWLIAWLFLWVFSAAVYGFRTKTGVPIYSAASERYLQNEDMFAEIPGLDPWAYPAIIVLPSVPFSLMPDALERIGWAGFNAGLFVISLFLIHGMVLTPLLSLARERGESAWRSIAAFWGLVALITIRHALATFENQSQDMIVLLAICAGMHASLNRREGFVGLWWGLAAALKMTPLLFLPLLLIQGRVRAFTIMLCAFMAWSVLPDILVPTWDTNPRALQFVEFVSGTIAPGQSGGEIWAPWNELNQNLAGTVHRITNEPSPERIEQFSMYPLIATSESTTRTLTMLGQLGIISLVGLFAWRTRTKWWNRKPPLEDPASRVIRTLSETGVVASAMLLLSPMSSKSHFVVLIIPAAAIVLHFLRRPNCISDILVILGVVIAGSLTGKDLIGRPIAEALLAGGCVAFCALLFLLGLSVLPQRDETAKTWGHSKRSRGADAPSSS